MDTRFSVSVCLYANRAENSFNLSVSAPAAPRFRKNIQRSCAFSTFSVSVIVGFDFTNFLGCIKNTEKKKLFHFRLTLDLAVIFLRVWPKLARI